MRLFDRTPARVQTCHRPPKLSTPAVVGFPIAGGLTLTTVNFTAALHADFTDALSYVRALPV